MAKDCAGKDFETLIKPATQPSEVLGPGTFRKYYYDARGQEVGVSESHPVRHPTKAAAKAHQPS